MMLNPIIKGWGNYYKYGASGEIFHRMDWEIFKKIWQWARRRHPQKCKGWVKDKYFRTLHGRSWRFAADMSKKDKIDYLELTYLPTIHHENSSRFDIMPIRMTQPISRTTNGEKPTE